MKNSIVCLDTQIVIWGVKKQSTPDQSEMILRAEYLLEKFLSSGTKILVPSIVVAEILRVSRKITFPIRSMLAK